MAGSEAEERIRAKGEAFLRKTYPGARIIHELKLNNGETRIDLAAVMPNRIVLAEVKSEKDVLDRLARQIRDCQKITGWVYAFVAEKHREKLERAMSGGDGYDRELSAVMWWSVGLMYEADGALIQKQVFYDIDRTGLQHRADTRALLDLLWAEELKRLCEAHSLSFGRKATMAVTQRVALENLNGRQIREGVCAALLGRPFARADEQALPEAMAS